MTQEGMERVVERAEVEFGLDEFAANVREARSVRIFDEGDPVEYEVLVSLVDMARQCASAANLQPLRYRIVTDPVERASVFDCLRWAGYLKQWPGPEPGRRPTGYVIVLSAAGEKPDTLIDLGIAAQTMVLGASEAGVGACMIRSFDGARLMEAAGLAGSDLSPLLVIAFGTADQRCVLEPMADGDVKYWFDDTCANHVPKRPLTEVLI